MANQYHSTYRGYDIYYRDDAKRRPWSVYIPQHDRFAAKASLEDCGDMIDKMTHSEPPMTKQKMIDILKLIIAKSPAAAREASTAIRAINADSPIIQQRCNWVAEMALNDRQADFSADDRAYIASLMDSEGDSEITSVSVRMTKVQVAEARRLAEEQGYADLSKFIRDRIGLPE